MHMYMSPLWCMAADGLQLYSEEPCSVIAMHGNNQMLESITCISRILYITNAIQEDAMASYVDL